jgi:hypothetical protein
VLLVNPQDPAGRSFTVGVMGELPGPLFAGSPERRRWEAGLEELEVSVQGHGC